MELVAGSILLAPVLYYFCSNQNQRSLCCMPSDQRIGDSMDYNESRDRTNSGDNAIRNEGSEEEREYIMNDITIDSYSSTGKCDFPPCYQDDHENLVDKSLDPLVKTFQKSDSVDLVQQYLAFKILSGSPGPEVCDVIKSKSSSHNYVEPEETSPGSDFEYSLFDASYDNKINEHKMTEDIQQKSNSHCHSREISNENNLSEKRKSVKFNSLTQVRRVAKENERTQTTIE